MQTCCVKLCGTSVDINLCKLAIEASCAHWANGEGQTAKALHAVDDQTFRKWLKQWGLTRSVPRETREHLLRLLRGERHYFAGSKWCEAGWRKVDILSAKMKDDPNIFRRHLSLVSKFATALNPRAFFPFDKYAARAVTVLDATAEYPASYTSYMSFVERALGDYAECIKLNPSLGDELGQQMFRYSLPDADADVCQRRSLDKTFMLIGGFGRAKLRDEIGKLEMK